jgi:hypothetical protein
MNVKVILLFLVSLPAFTLAQCPQFELLDLHNLQRATEAQKESTIQSLGFDLRSSFIQRGESIQSYSKCWNSNFKGQSLFEQLLWWNKTTNAITLLTLNEAHYVALRKSIVNRNPGTKTTENPDFYLGKMFQYRFGGRRVDGIDYFFVQISYR